jgi:hypothetical protein
MHPIQLALNRNMFHVKHTHAHAPTQNMLTPALGVNRFIGLFETKVVNNTFVGRIQTLCTE